ncbi:hypothetical protein [[Mycoplasma] testudinis]|uniref:hypothetical protein n=1 Tax=[Mycoplasma] testudinis TaxID=33924 RepID=UPI000559C90E|nr:hypothetical protein [[Mycoplasma] testudinis]
MISTELQGPYIQHQVHQKKSFKLLFLKFLFPFYPIKIRHTTHLLVLLALMIAFRIVTQLFSIPLGPTMRIGVTWIPITIMGWIFGPIIGIPLGFLTDTITWAMGGGVWFWMYAIQESLIMIVAGIVAGIYHLRLNAKSWIWDLIFNQIVIVGFLGIGIFSLIYFGKNNFIENNGKTNNAANIFGLGIDSTQILTATTLAVFFVVMEIIMFYFLRQHIKHKKNPRLFLYVSLLVPLLSILFSFVMGTISIIELLNFLSNGRPNNNLINFGAYYYLVPRVLKEIFRDPILILVIVGVLRLAEPNLKQIRNKINNQW